MGCGEGNPSPVGERCALSAEKFLNLVPWNVIFWCILACYYKHKRPAIAHLKHVLQIYVTLTRSRPPQHPVWSVSFCIWYSTGPVVSMRCSRKRLLSRRVTLCIYDRNARTGLGTFCAVTPQWGLLQKKVRHNVAMECMVLLINAMRHTSITVSCISIQKVYTFRELPTTYLALWTIGGGARPPWICQCRYATLQNQKTVVFHNFLHQYIKIINKEKSVGLGDFQHVCIHKRRSKRWHYDEIIGSLVSLW